MISLYDPEYFPECFCNFEEKMFGCTKVASKGDFFGGLLNVSVFVKKLYD